MTRGVRREKGEGGGGGWDMTNQFVTPKELLPGCIQTDIGNAQLPAVPVRTDLGAQHATENLVPEAHAYDADAAAVEQALHVFHEPEDPLDVLIRGGLRSGDENGVDVFGLGVSVRFADDVVETEFKLGGGGLGRVGLG